MLVVWVYYFLMRKEDVCPRKLLTEILLSKVSLSAGSQL